MAYSDPEQDDLQSLIPSLSPIMGSGTDVDALLSSGNPTAYMAAARNGVPFNPVPELSNTPISKLVESAQPAGGPVAAAPVPPSPTGSAAVQSGDNKLQALSSVMPGIAQGLTESANPAPQLPANNAPNPSSEATGAPAVPSSVTPSGTPAGNSAPWSQLARESRQGAAQSLDDASTMADSRQRANPAAIEAQRVQLTSPQSGTNPNGMPNPKDPNHPEYRPSVGRRILRGLLGAGEGLATGGFGGMVLGALDPARVSGVAYGAPTSRFAQAAGRNAAAVTSLDQQLTQADNQAKNSDEAVKNKIAIAAQFAGLEKEDAANLTAQSRSGMLDATLAKAGMKAVRDENGNLTDIQDDPNSEVFKQRTTLDDLRKAQTDDAEAQEELRRSQTDPNSPAFKLAQERAATARGNLAAAQERANAYMLNAYGANLGTNPFNGQALPGSTQTDDGTPMGSRFQQTFAKHEGAAAQFNDVGGAIDNLETAARAMHDKGQALDNTLVAAALAQPEGTASQWLQGQVAKSNLSPEQRDYVINLVSARENLQALRKAGGLAGTTEAQVDRLLDMLPSQSTPDLDYFLRQTNQIKQTRDRLAAGIPGVTGGTQVHSSAPAPHAASPAPARPAGVPANATWNEQAKQWQRPKAQQ